MEGTFEPLLLLTECQVWSHVSVGLAAESSYILYPQITQYLSMRTVTVFRVLLI